MHAIWWDILLYRSDVSFLINVIFAYFAYLNQWRDITSEHWLTNILFFSALPNTERQKTLLNILSKYLLTIYIVNELLR